jgi:HEAT repeats
LGAILLPVLVGCGEVGAPADPGLAGGHYAADASDLPRLIVGLKARSPEARARAAAALGGLGPAAKPAVTDLIAALKDRDPGVRQAAAFALGRIGPDAIDALPALRSLARGGPASAVATKAIESIEHGEPKPSRGGRPRSRTSSAAPGSAIGFDT